jgi:hypothetical protein
MRLRQHDERHARCGGKVILQIPGSQDFQLQGSEELQVTLLRHILV